MIIWVKCVYVYKVWMNVREFWSVQALYVTTNALYWKFLEMQNSMHLTLLKHQNTKNNQSVKISSHNILQFSRDFRNLVRWIHAISESLRRQGKAWQIRIRRFLLTFLVDLETRCLSR